MRKYKGRVRMEVPQPCLTEVYRDAKGKCEVAHHPCSLGPTPLGNGRLFHQFHCRSKRRMARVTVEDCIDKVENRFDLVLLASHRARMISSGSPITIER